MSSHHENVSPTVRRLATLTCVVALLPIGMGALVTTLKAGMAFADWPSSDGQNMLLYPWFQDFSASPEKFTEHGHRLAGMLIGLVSVILTVSGCQQKQRWVRNYTLLILAAVICQGLLGGARVLLDKQVLAMTHSITGAGFFSMCVVFRLWCSTSWSSWTKIRDDRLGASSAGLIAMTSVAIVGQYFLGGMLRHLHLMLNEHVLGAIIIGGLGTATAFCLLRSSHPLLRCCGFGVAATLICQLLLGIGSYIARFGLPSIGYVATSGSLFQAVVCSLHTVVGMTLFTASVLSVASMVRLYRADCLTGLSLDAPVVQEPGRLA